MSHLAIVPILVPLVAGVLLLAAARAPLGWRRVIALAATAAGAAIAVRTVAVTNAGVYLVYRLGDWPPPFGILLTVDRLGALLLLATSAVAFASLLAALRGTDARSPFFHPLFQFQLAGVNGAFVTGDLFNLFVFFEMLLIASYGLLLYGGGVRRTRAGLHYVVLNLTGSALFLIAVGTLYGVTGTLNLADLALRVPALGPEDRWLADVAGLLLLVVFGLKAAVVPLHLWLPRTYAAASAPVAALFAIMTKVGVYAILRVHLLLFAPAGDVSSGASPVLRWVLVAGVATQLLGAVGAFGTRHLGHLVGYLLVASVGTMLAGLGLFTPAGLAGGLYYLLHSTVTIALLFLLADAIAQTRGRLGGRLVPGPAVHRPALLGVTFAMAAVAVVGLPPLAGFLGKAMILAAAPPTATGAWVWGAVLGGGALTLVATMRAGTLLFWQATGPAEKAVPDAKLSAPARGGAAAGAIALLAALLVALTVAAEPVHRFTSAVAEQLLHPAGYVAAVRPAPW